MPTNYYGSFGNERKGVMSDAEQDASLNARFNAQQIQQANMRAQDASDRLAIARLMQESQERMAAGQNATTVATQGLSKDREQAAYDRAVLDSENKLADRRLANEGLVGAQREANAPRMAEIEAKNKQWQAEWDAGAAARAAAAAQAALEGKFVDAIGGRMFPAAGPDGAPAQGGQDIFSGWTPNDWKAAGFGILGQQAPVDQDAIDRREYKRLAIAQAMQNLSSPDPQKRTAAQTFLKSQNVDVGDAGMYAPDTFGPEAGQRAEGYLASARGQQAMEQALSAAKKVGWSTDGSRVAQEVNDIINSAVAEAERMGGDGVAVRRAIVKRIGEAVPATTLLNSPLRTILGLGGALFETTENQFRSGISGL